MRLSTKQLRDYHIVKDLSAVTAYTGILTQVLLPDNRSYLYDSSSTATVDGGIVLAATGKGSGRWIGQHEGRVNIKRWYGAVGDSTTNDGPAIQKAVSYIRTQSPMPTLVFPHGKFLTNTPLDWTNTNGLSVKGAGGRSQGTIIIGNTNGGVILDVSGSSKYDIRGLNITAPNGLANPSYIGIQSALTKDSTSQSTTGNQKGGIAGRLTDCVVEMGNFVGVNGGLGSIAYLNVRSEEVIAAECIFQGNTPVVLSNQIALQASTGFTFTASSNYAFLQDNASGSMGVIKMTGCSLYGFERLTPAVLLNGTNGFDFQGYMGRPAITDSLNNSYETAIRSCQTTINIHIKATIESYSTVFEAQNQVYNSSLKVASANVKDATRPLIILREGSLLHTGNDYRITIPNPSERPNRFFLWTEDINSGNSPSTTVLLNNTFACSDITDNSYFIKPNLLKQAGNNQFLSATPFKKEGGYVYLIGSYPRTIGTVQSGGTTQATLTQFTLAFNPTGNVSSGGHHHCKVDGILQLGDANTVNGPCFVYFQGSMVWGQRGDGVSLSPDTKCTVLNQVTFNGGYLNITGLSLAVAFSSTVASLVITISTAGSGVGESVSFSGTIGIMSTKFVNHTIPMF